MEFSNADKARHGQNAQSSLESILSHCIEIGQIISVGKNYRAGKSGYGNDSQFYAPFMIEFQTGEKWILFSTTSMRTDRIKEQQWDAYNLKSIDSSIQKAFLIYPDYCKDENEFKRQNTKYTSHEEYTAIDRIVSQNQIANLIEECAIKDKNAGQRKDIQGNNYESRVARLLSYSDNLKKWKTNSSMIEGIHYGIFKQIVNAFEILPETTTEIWATSDKKTIGKLPSGGNPKTDVLVEVKNNKGESVFFTISCKCSCSNSVSVHQYTANAFADVLNKDDMELRSLLNAFQKAGGMENFGAENCEKLKTRLEPYREKLSKWVLGGYGGGGNSEKQCASYILTYNSVNDTSKIHRLEDYCRELAARGVGGNFGTPFSWTYPSKRRGESIQLKCRMI